MSKLARYQNMKMDNEITSTTNDEKWMQEKNVKFSIASQDDIPELIDFIQNEFLKEEPTHRMIKTMEGNSLIDRYFRNMMVESFIKNPIRRVEFSPACTVARSTIDNSILGCRMGEIVSRENGIDESIPPIMWIKNLPSFFPLSKKLIDIINLVQLMKDLRYGKQHAFEDLIDTDRIYIATKVCVSAKARGLGLGTELVKRGYDLARRNGCGYTYVLASSIYSQRIFHKLGQCRVLHEVSYDDYKYDKKGRPFLFDPQEHKTLQVLAISHIDVDVDK